MTPHQSGRLLADIAALGADHPIDVGTLGEYALVGRQRGPDTADETYPSVAAHLRVGCERCEADLKALAGLARRAGGAQGTKPSDRASALATREQQARAQAGPPGEQAVISPREQAVVAPGEEPSEAVATPSESSAPAPTEPVEVADAVALARTIEAEHEALRKPLRPDRFGQIDTRRETARRRQILLVEAALVRQRLIARRLFLDRAVSALGPSSAAAGRPITPAAGRPTAPTTSGPTAAAAGGTPGQRRAPIRPLNPKAGLLLDEYAGQVDDLGRLANRIARLLAELRRLGDNPSGPARPQAEALAERGLSMTRDALAIDRRVSRLHGPLSGMLA